jgi:endonuclease/exonuclease/phosphatase family metal-dependent hydrolase
MRVATWNIRAAIGPGEPFPRAWWRHVSRDRMARIAGIIDELDADLIALQEVSLLTPNGHLHDQPAELARLTGMHVRYAAVHAFTLVEPEDGRAIGAATWGNAILSRRQLEDGFACGLPVGADDDLVEPAGGPLPLAGVTFADAPYGTREPRCAVGGRLTGPSGRVSVVNAHLTYAGTDQRRAQAEMLASIADDLGSPVILAGDFNATPDSDEVRMLTGDAAVPVPGRRAGVAGSTRAGGWHPPGGVGVETGRARWGWKSWRVLDGGDGGIVTPILIGANEEPGIDYSCRTRRP